MKALALAFPLLWPYPRDLEPAPDTRLRLPLEVVARAECEAPADLLRRELTALFGPDAVGRGGTTIRLALTPEELPRPEEYAVEPRARGLLLSAHDTQGAYWAVHALATRLGGARRVDDGYRASIPRVRDWPDTTFRAFMIQGAWTPNLDEYKRNLELLARLRISHFALEFGPQVVLDFDPEIARGGRFTKAQAREVIDYGRSLGLEPIGYLNLLGHLERAYERSPYTQHGGIDLRSEAAYEEFVYPILSEMLEVYGPVEYFHCGMDEAWELFTWLSQEGSDPVALLAQHIERVNSFLRARGVKLVIWHDMLIAPELAEQLGGPVGPANGGPPQNCAAALGLIPKDVILDYWFYDPLATYPALDYLRGQGFAAWASPWQTPFSLVRYAQSRQAPTLGTLWTGPPGCFASPTYSPVTALYAQATWDGSVAADEVAPEPEIRAAAQRATSAVVWRRRELTFPGREALLLTTAQPRRVRWPGDDVEQHSGVPLDTSQPVRLDPLPDLSRPLAEGAGAAAVLIPGGVRVALDGANAARGEDQLVLYAAPRERTGTNLYGAEVSVSASGVVLESTGYGSGDHPIPTGGFVLSAHLGPRSEKARLLEGLRPGDRVSVLDAHGEWIGGSAAARLLVELPGGEALRIGVEDAPRGADELVLYHPGYGAGRTGTNEFGVEVVVRAGVVVEVRDRLGDTPIPPDGYVLSAHTGERGESAAALRGLKGGDALRLVLERGGQRHDLAAMLATRRQAYPIEESCAALFLAFSAGASSSPGTPLGEWVVSYADGIQERVPVRYGREALPAAGDALPERTDDPVWLIDEPPLRCLVREWANPRPDEPLRDVAFEPAPAILETGAQIVAVTAAVRPGE
jgi:hypothetical protein